MRKNEKVKRVLYVFWLLDTIILATAKLIFKYSKECYKIYNSFDVGG